jgi:hypothetical protein
MVASVYVPTSSSVYTRSTRRSDTPADPRGMLLLCEFPDWRTRLIPPILKRTLVRNFYFAEALAVYELYYTPLVSTYPPARKALKDSGRQEDRPPTWVPLVFHCTGLDQIEEIIASGQLKPNERGFVAFTELPIGELDRMLFRKPGKAQAAIGFPRRYTQSLGLSPVWYLKHNPELRDAVNFYKTADPGRYAKVAPFIEERDDVSSFQEVRVARPVAIGEAIWILTTVRNEDKRSLVVPGLSEFEERYGRISKSYWHRTHQLGILGEWQYTAVEKDETGQLTEFRVLGEHYWKPQVMEEQEIGIRLPVDEKQVLFETMQLAKRKSYSGPWRFFDVARMIAGLLSTAGENLEEALPHRMTREVADIAWPAEGASLC